MSEADIHPDALEAAAKALSVASGYDETWWDECVARFGKDWGLLDVYRRRARITCTAMLKAWPGKWRERPLEHEYLCLPLSQE